MKLNKNSKWINFYLCFNVNYPNNFCDYFWGSIKSISIMLSLITITLLLLFSLLSPILLFWYDLNAKSVLSDFQFCGILIWFTTFIVFFYYIYTIYLEKKQYKSTPKKKYIIKQ